MSGLRYLSVCSGIEAASVAWHGLGWTPVGFSEIEPFPSAVLAHHYPHVPNLGDMTNFKEWNLGTVDLLVGGTPCQSFSVAGLRKGLDDPRGNLMLTFLAIAERHRPRWIIWENVPGVLSSNKGRDFGTFLGALGELGYGWAYRVLDAQWFGVAQRRRRVFVVGCLGDQASAAAVLFESESVQRNPSPSRETRQGVARGVTRCFAGSSESGVAGSHWDHPSNPHPTLNQSAKGSGGIAASDQELFSQRGSGLVPQPVAIHPHVVGRSPTAGPQGKEWIDDGSAYCMDARGVPQAVAQPVATFAKTHKPMSSTDAEGWSPVDAAPTVTHWPRDRSDAGTDVAIVQPVGVFQDSEFGVQQYDSAGTLRAGRIPEHQMVMQPVAFHHNAQASQLPTAARDTSISDSLTVSQQAAVALAFKVRGGVEVDSAGKAAGKGYLGSEETAFTLAATQDQWLAAPVPVGTDCYNGAITGDVAATIGTPGSSVNASGPTVMQPLNFYGGNKRADRPEGGFYVKAEETSKTLDAASGLNPTCSQGGTAVMTAMQVRRLTPVECERLQGFPDGYTNIPWRNKPESPDGPRYKALGNSMAVPCMKWIGERIAKCDSAITKK